MGEQKWLNMVMPHGRPSLQGWSDRNTMLKDMDAGIDRCVPLGWYWENHLTCIESNRWHHQWIKQIRLDFLLFFPSNLGIPNLSDYLKQAKEDGFLGIGESHPWAQDFSMDNEEWMMAMEFASPWLAR